MYQMVKSLWHLPETSPDLTKGDLEGVSEDLVGNGDEEEA